MTPLNEAEIVARWPDQPPKPLTAYTDDELRALAKFGPAVIGGPLYLRAQAVRTASVDGRYGVAILSDTPVEPVGETALAPAGAPAEPPKRKPAKS